MSIQDLYNLKRAAEEVVEKVSSSEKFFVSPLAVRLTKAAMDNPGDTAIISMASFLQKRAQGKDIFISRGELKDVYSKLYSSNTRCSSYLEKELDLKEQSSVVKMAHIQDERPLDETLFRDADPMLVNVFESVFDKNAEYKPYSLEIANRAKSVCLDKLNSMGLNPKRIELASGNTDCILCSASYETPKGMTSVIIPVETVENKALVPTVFVSTSGFENLSKETLEKQIVTSAGKNYKVNVGLILQAIHNVKHTVAEPMNDVEAIVLKTKLAGSTPATYDFNNILMQKVDEESPTVEVNKSKDSELFGQRLASTDGVAEMKFGKKAVELARSMIVKAVRSYGINAQVAIADVAEKSVVFSVKSGSSGFKVPVKVDENGMPEVATIAMAGGKIENFDKNGISNLLSLNDFASGLAASPMYGLKASELIEVAQKAIDGGNQVIVEDSLATLSSMGETDAFNYVFNLYKSSMSSESGLKKTASKESTCSNQIKKSNSMYVVCGHTNLPLNKVYQDQNGNCVPLYRKNIDHTNEGGTFMHSVVYLDQK